MILWCAELYRNTPSARSGTESQSERSRAWISLASVYNPHLVDLGGLRLALVPSGGGGGPSGAGGGGRGGDWCWCGDGEGMSIPPDSGQS